MAVETPRFLQVKPYSAKAMRAILLDGPLQNGVVGAGDLMVTQRGAGANMSVDVAAGAAWIKGTATARQGLYDLYNDAVVNVGIAAANASNPRIDQIIARVYDSTDGGSGQDIGAIEVITGTATSGATLNNRTGVGAVPAHAIILADVLIPAAAASIANTVIRDRRPWARGAYVRVQRNINASAANDYTTTSAAQVLIDAANIQPRVECSGVPLLLSLRGSVKGSVSPQSIDFSFAVDGTPDATRKRRWDAPAATTNNAISVQWDYVPTAGSRLLSPVWQTSTGTATLLAQASWDLEFTVRESVGQNSANNTVTSG